MEAQITKQRLPAWLVYLIFGLLCLGVLFLLRLVRPPTLRTTFSLYFPDIYQSSPTVEIAGFTEAERWKGTYTLDSERSIDGETGMNVFSMNAIPAKITLQKNIDLKGYDGISVFLFVSGAENLQNIKSLTVSLTDSRGNDSSYDLTGLKVGWNLTRLKLADFKPAISPADITSISVALTAKAGQTTQLTLDRIWAQHALKSDGLAKMNSTYTNLETLNKKTFLHFSSAVPINTYVAKSTTASRFAYTVGLSPLKLGMFGLSFLQNPTTEDGYYFLISGKQMNEWHLLKKEGGHETELQRGTLPGNTFETGAMIWLRTEKDGDEISASYTINGQQYIPITKYRDTTFSKGSFGTVSLGSYLIESVDIKE